MGRLGRASAKTQRKSRALWPKVLGLRFARPNLRGGPMKPATAPSALKVQAVLGPHFQVLEFDASTRTSEEAAAAVGCTVAEIAKSLIFKAADGRPVLVIASGA